MHTKVLERETPSFLVRYGIALLSVVIAAFLTALLLRWGFAGIFLLFFVAVVVSAWLGGFGPALLACVLSALTSTFFIDPPFDVSTLKGRNLGHLVLFILISLLICWLGAARRRSEAARRGSEEHYRLLFERNLAGVFLSTIDGGMLDCNEAFARIVGYDSREEVLTHHASDFYFETADRKTYLEHLQKEGRVTTHEVCIRGNDERPVWVLENVSLLNGDDEAQALLQGTIIEITERKREEDELRKQKELLQAVFDHAPVMMSFYREDGHIKMVNREWERARGWSLEEIEKQDLDVLAMSYPDPVSRQRVRDFMTEATGEWGDFKTRVKGGRVLDTTWAVVPLSDGTRVCMGRDITERKRAEARSAAFATLARKLSGALTQLDAGRIIAETAEDLFGWDSCNLDLYDAGRDLTHPMLNVDMIGGKRTDFTTFLSDQKPTARGKRVIDHGPELVLREEPIQFDADAIPSGDKTRPSASIMTVPVRHADRVIGLLSIQSYTPRAYDAVALSDFQALADHCGEALNHIRAEEELRESEERYRDLVENSRELICTHDLDGRILSANRAAAEVLGYDAKDYSGKKNLREILIPQVRDQFGGYLARIRKDGFATGLMLVQTSSGERRIWEYYNTLRSEGVATPIVRGMAHDITERKRAENALQESEARFRQLSDAAFEAIILHDQGTILEVNQSFCRMYGYERAEVIGKSVLDLALPEFREPLLQRVRSGGASPFEGLALRKDGTIFRAELAAKPIHYEGRTVRVAAIRDITEQKRNERRQAAQYAVTRVLAESATLAEATPKLLQVICESLRWKMGECWRVCDSSNLLRCVETWHVPALDATSFIEASRQTELAPGVGLPGRVWQSGQPAWIPDVMTDPGFERAAIVAKVGLRGAVAFPILLGNHSLGVMLFFSRRAPEVDEDLLKIMSAIGSQIGQFTERKQIEAALRGKSEELDRYFNDSLDLLCIAGTDGYFRRLNPEWERTLGYSLAELEGRRFLDFVHPDDVAATLAVMRKLSSQEYVLNFINRYRHQDGSYRWIEWRSYPADDVIYAVARDITERRRAEAALRESEQEQRLFNLATNDMFWKWDFATDRVVRNIGFERAFGYSEHEITPLIGWWEERLRPDDQERVLTAFQTALKRGDKTCSYEYHFRRHDGSYATISDRAYIVRDESGKAVRAMGAMTDITERKRAEEVLRLRESYLTAILENQPGLVWLKDVDSRFLTVNHAFADSCGKASPAELAGKTDLDIWPRELAEKYRADDARIIKNKASLIVEEPIFDRGKTTWFETFKTPILDDQGDVIGTTGYSRDITERKRGEESLREAERKYHDIFEYAVEGIFRTTPDGRFIAANPALASMLGYDSPADLIQDQSDLARQVYVEPQRREEFKQRLGEHGMARDFEFEVRRKDGSKIWISEQVRAVGDETGTLLYYEGTAEDITERKRIEKALRTHAAQLTDAQHLAHLGSWEWDIPTDTVTWSDELHRIWGIDRKEFCGTYEGVLQCIHPDDREAFDNVVQTSYRELNPYTCDHRIIRTDQEIRRVQSRGDVGLDEAGNPVRMFGTSQDITERKLAEEALRESEERYRNLFENAHDAIYVHDLNGIYSSVNRAAEQLSGYSRGEIIGKNFADFVAPKYLNTVRANIKEKLGSRSETAYEIEVTARDGHSVPVEISSRLIYENGVAVGVQGMARDISDRKRAEEALRTFPRRLIGAQEAERRRVARELHDEIGQALTAIKINLQNLRYLSDVSSLGQELIESNCIVDRALQQVRDLSHDLRPSLLDDLGLVAALRWYVEREARRAGLTLDLNIDLSGIRLAPEIETACFRVAQEAFTNAVRHAQAKRVKVDLGCHDADLKLVIRDDGVGFDVGVAQNGLTSEASLGLQGMQERVNAVGGRIEIDSSLALGTEIRVQLPFMASPSSPEDN